MPRAIIRPDELASLVALAIWQSPGDGPVQLPGAEALAAGFSVPPATAQAALSRLADLGLASPEGTTAVARGQAGPLLGIMAAAGACRLKALSAAGSSAAALSEARELLLRTGRSALRGQPPPEPVAGMARKILRGLAGDDVTDMGKHPLWRAAIAAESDRDRAAVPAGPVPDVLSAVVQSAFGAASPNPALEATTASGRPAAHVLGLTGRGPRPRTR